MWIRAGGQVLDDIGRYQQFMTCLASAAQLLAESMFYGYAFVLMFSDGNTGSDIVDRRYWWYSEHSGDDSVMQTSKRGY